MTLVREPIDFSPAESNLTTVPAEQRGAGRDDVRLMVARRFSPMIQHDRFGRISDHLREGDALAVNVSATLPSSLDAWSRDGTILKAHFASPVAAGLWTVEIRTPIAGGGTTPGPVLDAQRLTLRGGGHIDLLAKSSTSPRLWVAAVEGVGDVVEYLQTHGSPIRYLPGAAWPITTYQTIFASVPGSAEMPSAGRPFTHELVTNLITRGVAIVPIVLHAGLSSFEDDEAPGEERFTVPASTASVLNTLRAAGGRVLAVGTTVVRALESVVDETGTIHPGHGVTDLVVTSESGVRAVDGLLTGWHEPRSSHLQLLEAFLHRDRLQEIYDQAIDGGYLWHEFGDLLLMMP